MKQSTLNEAVVLQQQLLENYELLKDIVFCNNCSSRNSCYMYQVFSFVGLQTGYCAAGVAVENKADNECLSLIEKLSNPNLVNHDLIKLAKHKIREQNRILRRYTYCEDCDNHGCCDAEDTMIHKQIKKPYCGVGTLKARE